MRVCEVHQLAFLELVELVGHFVSANCAALWSILTEPAQETILKSFI